MDTLNLHDQLFRAQDLLEREIALEEDWKLL
jgi:hypothetical protein